MWLKNLSEVWVSVLDWFSSEAGLGEVPEDFFWTIFFSEPATSWLLHLFLIYESKGKHKKKYKDCKFFTLRKPLKNLAKLDIALPNTIVEIDICAAYATPGEKMENANGEDPVDTNI